MAICHSRLALSVIGVLVAVSACASDDGFSVTPTPTADESPDTISQMEIVSAPAGTQASISLGGGRSLLASSEAGLTIKMKNTSSCDFKIGTVRAMDETLYVEIDQPDATCEVVPSEWQRDNIVIDSSLVQTSLSENRSLVLQTPDDRLLRVPLQIGLT